MKKGEPMLKKIVSGISAVRGVLVGAGLLVVGAAATPEGQVALGALGPYGALAAVVVGALAGGGGAAMKAGDPNPEPVNRSTGNDPDDVEPFI